MEVDQIREIVKILEESGLNELNLKKKNFEIHLVKEPSQNAVMPQSAPANQMQAVSSSQEQTQTQKSKDETQTEEESSESEENLEAITSPMVGTFYKRPSPEAEDFVSVGDTVNEDTIVCLIEAMKIFNEVKSEISGEIKKILVEDGEPVEYGQKLFLVDPK